MKRAIFSGSFDPITSGHCDLLCRAAELFDEVYIVAANNAEKNSMFSLDERLDLIKAAVSELSDGGIKNVIPDSYSGLLIDYMHAKGIKYIVRGVRNSFDYEYEYDLASIMKRFDPECETVILPSDPALSAVSSTYVRELIKYGCPFGDSVTPAVAEMIKKMR